MYHTSERPEYIERLRAEHSGIPYRPAKRKKQPPPPPDPDAARSLFTVETGNRWMELGQREPPAKMLFGEFWHQGEVCILFADTNAGKSILAVQIGDSIARSRPIAPFACQAPPANVLYVDFELTTTQFYQRYSYRTDGQGDHDFPRNFYRAQFNNLTEVPEGFTSYDHYLTAGLAYKINQVKATVLIIDNITCLRGGTENAPVALQLMQNLKTLRADHHLSILVLAHTPKQRKTAQPLAADHLQGSKLLINFADSAFAIGKSNTDAGLCYLKQIKQRNTRQFYGEDNVCLCRIAKGALSNTGPGNFLHFTFEGNSAERPHLLSRTAAQREQLAKQVADLAATGLSQRQIADELKIGLGTVNKLIRLIE